MTVPSGPYVAPAAPPVGAAGGALSGTYPNPGVVQAAVGLLAIFGNGSDGAAVFDGITTPVAGATLAGSTYTATRDIMASSITVNSGVTVKPNGYRIMCTGTLTNNGIISAAGNAAAAGAAGAAQSNNSLTGGRTGGAGGTGVSGTGANGGAGNIGNNGGAGGAGTSGAAGTGGTVFLSAANALASFLLTPFALLTGISGYGNSTFVQGWGAGGGGGGSDAASNAGGGGGGGGGIIAIFAGAVINNGTITVAGGAGAAGTGGNAGGGGGGAGGLIAAYTLTAWTAGTLTTSGGALGAGVGTGSAGTAGGAGASLNVVI